LVLHLHQLSALVLGILLFYGAWRLPTDVRFRNDFSQPDGVWVGGNYSGNGRDPVPFSRLIDDILIVTNPAENFDHLAAIDAAFSSL